MTLVSKEGNRVELTIDGKPVVVDIVMAENGSCSILHDGNSYNAELIRGEGGKSYDVNMFYRSYHVDVVDTQAKYLHLRKDSSERQSDKIVAPMPGKVVSIPVAVGDRLKAGGHSRGARGNEDAEQLQGELRLHRAQHIGGRGRLGTG